MRVVVGSTNPAKIEAVKIAFSKYFDEFEVEGVGVSSGVAEQPVDENTLAGARNRARALRHLKADFFVGLESGIMKMHGVWFIFGYTVVMDGKGREGIGTTPMLQVPSSILDELLSGVELGPIAGRVTGDPDVKKKGGIVSYLTKGVIDRKDYYVSGIVMALAPFMNEKMYFRKRSE